MIHFAKFEQKKRCKNLQTNFLPQPTKYHYAGIIFKPNGPDLAAARPQANPLFHCYQEKIKQHYLVSISWK